MKDKIELKQSGLQCDNIECDWKDITIPYEKYSEYVNCPCPKCGENILTEHDFNLATIFHNAVDLVNTMSEDEVNEILKHIGADTEDNTTKTIRVGLHNEITFEEIENATERGDKDSHN